MHNQNPFAMNIESEDETGTELTEYKPAAFRNVPDEIIKFILTFLELSNLLHMGQTSKRFSALILDNHIWNNLLIDDSQIKKLKEKETSSKIFRRYPEFRNPPHNQFLGKSLAAFKQRTGFIE